MERVMAAGLQLVYPPVSNQEADWLKSDGDVLATMKNSALYMIGRRVEYFFQDYEITSEPLGFRFDLVCDGGVSTAGLNLDLSFVMDACPVALDFEAGDKFLRVWDGARGELLYWCTVDKLLHDVWRNVVTVQGLADVRPFTQFELLYVGISKSDDAFQRLVVNPHEKRVAALTNELPLSAGARVSDELWFFFFDIEPLFITTFDLGDDDIDVLDPQRPERSNLVSDAEKAFVSLLQAKYNIQRFAKYPFSTDGLYDEGLTRYVYVLDEDITFNTETERFRGAFGALPKEVNKNPAVVDLIMVEGDQITLYKHES